MGKYGDFTADGLEYVIRTPHTPRDWFNFFWNPTYLASAGQSMNGCSLFQSEGGVVTNLFGKQDMREDPRNVYLRDANTGEFWSAGYLPCHTQHEEFSCRHGLGYTVLGTLHKGVRVEFRLFVPRKDSGEVWTITVTNESRRARRLSLFSVRRGKLRTGQYRQRARQNQCPRLRFAIWVSGVGRWLLAIE